MTRDRVEQLYCYLSLYSKISGNTYSLYMIFFLDLAEVHIDFEG